MTGKEIIARCNTCRTAIYKGDIIWTSQTGQSSGYTKGAYGGVSQEVGHRSGTTVHGGTYGAKHTGEHSSENWTQCGWCYDQWLAEIAAHDKWEKTPGITKWIWVWIITILATGGGLFAYYYSNKGKETLKPLGFVITGVITFFVAFAISFSIFTKPAYPEPLKPDRYRFRIRK